MRKRRCDGGFCFPEGVDRMFEYCPACKFGQNSRAAGGNERCFHCEKCWYVECMICECYLSDEEMEAMGK